MEVCVTFNGQINHEAVKDPMGTLESLDYVVNHMPETCWAIGTEVVNTVRNDIINGDSVDCGQVVGFAVMEIVTA